MAPSSYQVLAISALGYLSAVNGHGFMCGPDPEFTGGDDRTAFIATIPSSVFPSFGPNENAEKNAVKFAQGMQEGGFKDLKTFLQPYGNECGATNKNASPRPIPADGKMCFKNSDTEGLTASHHGPCEIWIDDQMIVHSDDCVKEFGSQSPTLFPVDYSKCVGNCLLQFYWVALQSADSSGFQVYKNCVPLAGSPASSGGAGGAGGASSSPSPVVIEDPVMTLAPLPIENSPSPVNGNPVDDYSGTPAEGTPVPADDGDYSTTPSEDVPSPVVDYSSPTPSEGSPVPADGGDYTTTPTEDVPSPVVDYSSPTPSEGSPVPADDYSYAPSGNTPSGGNDYSYTPSEGSPVPMDGGYNTPSEGSPVPMDDGYNTPSEGSPVPMDDGYNTPSEGSPVPIDDGYNTPSEGSPVPMDDGYNTPSEGFPVPVDDGYNTPAGNTPSHGGDYSTTPAEDTPVPNDGGYNTPSVGSPIPSNDYSHTPVENMPAPVGDAYPTPLPSTVPTEGAPAPVEQMPSPIHTKKPCKKRSSHKRSLRNFN